MTPGPQQSQLFFLHFLTKWRKHLEINKIVIGINFICTVCLGKWVRSYHFPGQLFKGLLISLGVKGISCSDLRPYMIVPLTLLRVTSTTPLLPWPLACSAILACLLVLEQGVHASTLDLCPCYPLGLKNFRSVWLLPLLPQVFTLMPASQTLSGLLYQIYVTRLTSLSCFVFLLRLYH